jgi:hypothetical protein
MGRARLGKEAKPNGTAKDNGNQNADTARIC